MNPKNFFAELKRRNVYKVGVAYAGVAWLLVQVTNTLFPRLNLPGWAVTLVIVLVLLGFPVALVLSWAFELTPEGIVSAEDNALNKSLTRKPGRKLAVGIVLVGTVAAALFAFQLIRPKGPSTIMGGRAAIPEKSIAVLPFQNLSDDKQNAYFTDGVQDEILTNLAKIADLKVISRTSVMQYKTGVQRNLREIGQQLGVAHLLEGSVQSAGGKVRVNAQMIDARTDRHLWAQVYDRPLGDVFAIQSEIAKAIAEQLQAKISPNERAAIERAPTADLIAFDLYSRAKNLLLTTTLDIDAPAIYLEALDLLNRAVARDSSFFEAFCLLAAAHDRLYILGHDHTPTRLALAETALQAAFRLRPDGGEAHLARAGHLYRGYLDFDGALAELELARRTLPNDSGVSALAGYIARRRGRHEESLHHLERALELDPRNFFILQQIALTYQGLRRYAEAVSALGRALAIRPDHGETAVARGAVEFDWKADTRPLRQIINAILGKDPDAIHKVADTWYTCALADRDAVAAASALTALGANVSANNAVHFSREFLEGALARMTNDEGKAHAAFTLARAKQEKAVQAQPNYGPVLCVLGLIDAGLGRKEEALREGRRAIELLPVSKDSINGVHMIEYFAMTAAWVGEKELACEQLAIATRLPGYLSYGQLKLLPYWDPLRGDPCFEKLLASLAPKSSSP